MTVTNYLVQSFVQHLPTRSQRHDTYRHWHVSLTGSGKWLWGIAGRIHRCFDYDRECKFVRDKSAYPRWSSWEISLASLIFCQDGHNLSVEVLHQKLVDVDYPMCDVENIIKIVYMQSNKHAIFSARESDADGPHVGHYRLRQCPFQFQESSRQAKDQDRALLAESKSRTKPPATLPMAEYSEPLSSFFGKRRR